MKTKNAILDYQLTDVLEMNFSKKQKVINMIKAILLDRPIKDFNLYSVFSFALEDALVVIGDGNFNRIKNLYFLNADSESFKMCCIHAEGKLSNGRKPIDSFQCERLAPA